MPYRRHKDEPIVEFIFIGKVTLGSALAELRQFYDEISTDSQSDYGVIVDLTRAAVQITYSQMRDVIQYICSRSMSPRKIAIFCESALNYGTARIFQSVHQNGASLVKISSNRAELVAWLKKEVEMRQNLSP